MLHVIVLMGLLGVVIENWVWPERLASWGSTPLVSIRVRKALGPTHIPFHCALGTLYRRGWGLWQWGVKQCVRFHVTPGLYGTVLNLARRQLCLRTCSVPCCMV